MGNKILVTCATGNVGREVVKALLEKGHPVVAAAMDARDAERVQAGAEINYFGLAKQRRIP